MGDAIDIEIEDQVAPQFGEDGPVMGLTGMFHPVNSTLTIARSTRATGDGVYGRSWDFTAQRTLGALHMVRMTDGPVPSAPGGPRRAAADRGGRRLDLDGDALGRHGVDGRHDGCLDLAAFLAVWTLMMTAMMLPATAPVAALYSRTINAHRAPRMAVFTVAYLIVWAAAGLPAYALAVPSASAGSRTPPSRGGDTVAAAVFAVCGVYQLTPLKDRCLARCRSPIGLMLRYASYPRARAICGPEPTTGPSAWAAAGRSWCCWRCSA